MVETPLDWILPLTWWGWMRFFNILWLWFPGLGRPWLPRMPCVDALDISWSPWVIMGLSMTSPFCCWFALIFAEVIWWIPLFLPVKRPFSLVFHQKAPRLRQCDLAFWGGISGDQLGSDLVGNTSFNMNWRCFNSKTMENHHDLWENCGLMGFYSDLMGY